MEPAASPLKSQRKSMWDFLALSDVDLERADLVAINLAVASGIESLNELDVGRYCRIVDDWTRKFADLLPSFERVFKRTPEKWSNNIWFFRIGTLLGFIGHDLGIQYNEDQKRGSAIYYTNPKDLFLHGLIDTRRGTCGTMAALHVAMCRRMGWPVSLACANAHLISRYDDGSIAYNVEATSVLPNGSFAVQPDDYYIKEFGLSKRAVSCGSDLRRLSAREMVGVFVGLRGRHYRDCNLSELADRDYCLSQVLFPLHRYDYLSAIGLMIKRGAVLFHEGEIGHPNSLEIARREVCGQVRGGQSRVVGNNDLFGSIRRKIFPLDRPQKAATTDSSSWIETARIEEAARAGLGFSYSSAPKKPRLMPSAMNEIQSRQEQRLKKKESQLCFTKQHIPESWTWPQKTPIWLAM